MTRLLLLALLGCQQGTTAAPAGSAGSAVVDDDTPAPQFAIERDGLPDDVGWRDAATAATSAWAASFNKLGATRVVVSPLYSPDKIAVGHLLAVTAFKDDQQVFSSAALMSRGRMINGGGARQLEEHLRGVGFPAPTKIPIGHIVAMLHVMRVAPRWTAPVTDWDFAKLDAAAGKPRATLVYDQTGAVLTLYRKRGELERLEVRFDRDAKIALQAARSPADTGGWVPVSE